MLFSWWRARTRRRVGLCPFPDAWDEFLRRGVKQVQWLSAGEMAGLRRWILVFLAEKRFVGCRGLQVSDEMRVTIAAQAGLVALGFDALWFDRLVSVVVHPGEHRARRSEALAGGGALEWDEARVGQAAPDCLMLSWPDTVDGGRMRDGPRSVVIHECAHLFDGLDGEMDGIPPLPAAAAPGWAAAMNACRQRFEVALDEGRSTAFDEYAAESGVEFFAVASECFFQDPHRLLRHDRELYGLLATAWRQDPRSRVPPQRR
ncbi:MAG: hypothetical protein EBR23_09785 [Planctomycetia bacterium]|nr:hypothetical protein [Planctomycetia bacterium]